MCSRYNLTSLPELVKRTFGLAEIGDFPPRYNIAPTQPVLIVRQSSRLVPEALLVRWGLLPGWVKSPRDFPLIVNARAETAAEKPAFRGGIRHRRCLVPATGFYEWTGPKGKRAPWLFRPRGGGLVAFGGVAETWLGADGSELDTMAILTVPASREHRAFHDRMPLLVPQSDFGRWLDCRAGDTGSIQDLLSAPPESRLECLEVSPDLNNPGNEGARLLLPSSGRLL